MIASWMLYAVLVGALFTVAAIALDRVAVGARPPMRIVWCRARCCRSPGRVARGLRAPHSSATAARSRHSFRDHGAVAGNAAPTNGWSQQAIDRALLIAWLGLSALSPVCACSRAWPRLDARAATWKPADIDGRRVRLSANVGPAVVGLRSMDVVLPRVDPVARRAAARDRVAPRGGASQRARSVSAVRRRASPSRSCRGTRRSGFRRGVCDWRSRSIATRACFARIRRPERYGMLMLTIAQRRSIGADALCADALGTDHAYSNGGSSPCVPHATMARVTVYGGSAHRRRARSPSRARCSRTRRAPRRADRRDRQHDVQGVPGRKDRGAVAGNVTPLYPEQLRTANIEGKVLAQFVVDTTGEPMVATVRVIERTDDGSSRACAKRIPKLRFSPAEVGRQESKAARADAVHVQPEQGRGRWRRDGDVQGRAACAQRKPRGPRAGGPKLMPPNTVYLEYQVEVPVTPAPGNSPPRYPTELRSANIEGEVMAQFIVERERPGGFELAPSRSASTNEAFASTFAPRSRPSASARARRWAPGEAARSNAVQVQPVEVDTARQESEV